MNITTRIIDTTTGRGAAGMPVRLDRYDGTAWEPVNEGETDADGRFEGAETVSGTHRLRFGTGPYFTAGTCFPELQVIFQLAVGPAEMRVDVAPYAYSARLEGR
ncbi:hydroxyisourate hydrolase [Actinocorallia longicatena]|uniref:Transthyretin/hydroxyisourate hydrolase domain-containing protein n=1 Tax=Actinocorallia longicatena TaxID=111803 RepID=A0ABP6QBI0_9ACTN